MIEQVSITATGVGGRFFALDPEEAIAALAVAFFRVTPEGSRNCILPACSADLVTLWNGTRPKKEESKSNKATAAYMFGQGG